VYDHVYDWATHAVAAKLTDAEPDELTLRPLTEMVLPFEEIVPADVESISHPAGAVTVKEASVRDDGVTENVKFPSTPAVVTPPVSVAVALGAEASACGAIRIATPAITMRTTVARMVRKRLCFIFRSFLSISKLVCARGRWADAQDPSLRRTYGACRTHPP
jgi:hypothetical protein